MKNIINSIKTNMFHILQYVLITGSILLSLASFYTTFHGLCYLINEYIAAILTTGIQIILFAASIKLGKNILTGKKQYSLILIFFGTLLVSSIFSYINFISVIEPYSLRKENERKKFNSNAISLIHKITSNSEVNILSKYKSELLTFIDSLYTTNRQSIDDILNDYSEKELEYLDIFAKHEMEYKYGNTQSYPTRDGMGPVAVGLGLTATSIKNYIDENLEIKNFINRNNEIMKLSSIEELIDYLTKENSILIFLQKYFNIPGNDINRIINYNEIDNYLRDRSVLCNYISENEQIDSHEEELINHLLYFSNRYLETDNFIDEINTISSQFNKTVDHEFINSIKILIIDLSYIAILCFFLAILIDLLILFTGILLTKLESIEELVDSENLKYFKKKVLDLLNCDFVNDIIRENIVLSNSTSSISINPAKNVNKIDIIINYEDLKSNKLLNSQVSILSKIDYAKMIKKEKVIIDPIYLLGLIERRKNGH